MEGGDYRGDVPSTVAFSLMEGAVERFGLDLALHGEVGDATVAFSLRRPTLDLALTEADGTHGDVTVRLDGDAKDYEVSGSFDWDEEMVVVMSFKDAHLERFALEMTASGDNDDGLSGKTGLSISVDGDELATRSSRARRPPTTSCR